MEKIKTWLAAAAQFNPLNDWLYPLLLDRYGHIVARRVCSALALLAMFTIVIPLVALLWVYNCLLDLTLNVVGGWFLSFRDHIQGVVKGYIGWIDGQPEQDDEDGYDL